MRFCVLAAWYFEKHGFSDTNARALLAQLRALGVAGVRINHLPASRHPEWRGYARTLARLCAEAGMAVCAHAPARDISATDPATRAAAVRDTCECIGDIGAFFPGSLVVVHPEDFGAVRRPGDDEQRRANCRESLRQVADAAALHDMRVALENMRWRPEAPRRTGMYAAELAGILDGLDPARVGICFDVGHANISEGARLAEAFRAQAARIIHMHVDDNDGRDDLHLQPGEGTIEWRPFLDATANSGYGGLYELEIKMPEGDDPPRFYARNVAYMKEASGRPA